MSGHCKAVREGFPIERRGLSGMGCARRYNRSSMKESR